MAGGFALAAPYALRATHWAVMADELQTAKLATSIGDRLSPVPRIHGVYYGALAQLYPLLLTPFFAAFEPPAAITAAHGLNAFLLASAAIPAYLLARRVTRSRGAAVFAAAVTAFTPWLVLSSTLLTESAAYPAFAWAVYLAHRAFTMPGKGADALALLGVALAYFARTQLFALAVALPVAFVLHERARLRAAAAEHRVLLGAYAAGGIALAALAAAGRAGTALGNYASTFEGDLLPAGIWRAAAVHLAVVVVAGGIAPFVLAAAWSLASVVRPPSREAGALAALVVVLIPLLTFEVASFDLRFTPGGFAQDRYLCYLAPVSAVGAAAALAAPRHRFALAALVVAVGAAFAALSGLTSFAGTTVIYWASPAAAFHPALATAASSLGVSPASLVRWGAVAVAVALAAALLRARATTLLAVVGVVAAGFGAYEAQYVFHRFALPETTRPPTRPAAARRDWIDAAAPGDVALLPNPYLGPEYWWEAELWNARVGHTLRLGGADTFTPFPATELRLDWATGEVRGDEPADLVVRAQAETRIRLAETSTLRENPPLVLVRVRRPYRAEWATRGDEPDGWTVPGKPVELRVYTPGARAVTVTLGAPAEATRRVRFTLASGGDVVGGTIDGGASRMARIALKGRTATIRASGSTRLPDGRVVGLHVEAVDPWP